MTVLMILAVNNNFLGLRKRTPLVGDCDNIHLGNVKMKKCMHLSIQTERFCMIKELVSDRSLELRPAVIMKEK